MVKYSSRETGRDRVTSSVPRSISPATAAVPREIAQVQRMSKTNGWLQNMTWNEGDEKSMAAPPIPRVNRSNRSASVPET